VNDRLTNALNRLAEEAAQTAPPPEIERALLAEFDRTSRRRRMLSWSIKGGAIAASIAIVMLATRSPQPPAPAAPSAAPQEFEQPFVSIPYVAPLGPYERAEIVRMNLPVAALISAGLPVRTSDAGAQVEADVLVGQDGRARAVRLVSVSTFN
jgi:hypothetical protein